MSQNQTAAARVPCPFCAEEIQPKAVKCPYCGEWLTGAPTGQDQSERIQQNADLARSVAQGVRGDRHHEGHFAMKTLVGVAAFVLVMVIIGGLDGLTLGLLIFVLIFLKARKDYYSKG